jgi:hypothetical protein
MAVNADILRVRVVFRLGIRGAIPRCVLLTHTNIRTLANAAGFLTQGNYLVNAVERMLR